MGCDYGRHHSETGGPSSCVQQDREELTRALGFVGLWKMQDRGAYRRLGRWTVAERRIVNRNQHYAVKIVESIQLSYAVLTCRGSLDL